MKFVRLFSNRGFSLIEILIVAALTALMASILIKNFSTRRFDFDQVANQVEADVRLAQTYSLAAKRINNTFRCGFGVTRVSTTTYNIYAGKDSPTNSCTPSFIFINAATTPIVKTIILDPRVVIDPFLDVFYLPPDPRLYISNGASPTITPLLITLRKLPAANCSVQTECRYICICPPGRIEVYKNSALCI